MNVRPRVFRLVLPVAMILVCAGFDAAVDGHVQRELRYTIYEEIDVGSTIGDVINDADLRRRHSDDVIRGLQFRFLSQPPCPIAIDATTGLLRTDGRIDRETVCQENSESQCLIRMDVAVTPMTYFAIVKVSVEIKDINDNSPEFYPNFKVHELMESSPVGTLLLLPAAGDLDVGRFSVQSYELILLADPYSNYFKLNSVKKPDKSTDLRLELTKPLDRETLDMHRLTIVAYDGDVTPRQSLWKIQLVEIVLSLDLQVFSCKI